jgi:hypothetical protein
VAEEPGTGWIMARRREVIVVLTEIVLFILSALGADDQVIPD